MLRTRIAPSTFCLVLLFGFAWLATEMLLPSAPSRGAEGVAFRPQADLPPLLEFLDGRPVETGADWPARRAQVRQLLLQYFTGVPPEVPPALAAAETLEEHAAPDGASRRRVRVTWDTPHQRAFELWIWLPAGPGPFPLLLIAPRDYQIPWAEMALNRGYAVCLYPGVDSHHREPDYPDYHSVWEVFRAEYPDATWSEIITKAWLASRSLDYLLDPERDYPLQADQIGIIGFSRYGKQAMIAAALDSRITSVVARSPGSPGSCPYRFTSRDTFAEAPADFPSEWFLPSLRAFTGHEHELPIDAHGWLALIAPRHCLIHTAHHDGAEPTFAVERAYRQGRRVYQLLGHPAHLRVQYRTGQHGPITDEHREENLDWFDYSFGRGTVGEEAFPEEFLHRFDWSAWKAAQTEDDLAEASRPSERPAERDTLSRRVAWLLGEPPDSWEDEGPYEFLTAEESAMMTHDRWAVPGVARLPASFGANVRGNVYYRTDAQGPRPVVIWLHPFSYHSGYNEGYGVQGTTVYHRLAQAGYHVLAFDQSGFGLRLLEGPEFYQQHPHWSRLGRMVHDVHRAVDLVVEGRGRLAEPAGGHPPPEFASDQVYLLGYALGGKVALHAAALDDRIAGVACFSGLFPRRRPGDARATGGLERFWKWHALVPKLGLYQGREEAIPYDYDELLRAIAPRPCLIVAPQRDRTVCLESVRDCVERARPAWRETADQPEHGITVRYPDDIGRFQADQHQLFLDWLAATRDGSAE